MVEIPEGDEVLHVLYDLDQRIQIAGVVALRRGVTYEQDGYTPHWRGIYASSPMLRTAVSERQSSRPGVTVLQDFRFAFRSLGSKPGMLVVAVVCLALGIGANVAMFSVINATLLDAARSPRRARGDPLRGALRGAAVFAA